MKKLSSNQVIQLYEVMNRFLARATSDAVQRFIEGMDLVKSIVYSEESLLDLRERLNLGFLTFVNYNLSTRQMAELSCCEFRISSGTGMPELWDPRSPFFLAEFLSLSEEELKLPSPALLIRKRGFRPARVPELLSFLGRYCGIISKTGSRTVAAGHLINLKDMPEEFQKCFMGAFWNNSNLIVDFVPVKTLRPSDTFLVVRTGQDPASE